MLNGCGGCRHVHLPLLPNVYLHHVGQYRRRHVLDRGGLRGGPPASRPPAGWHVEIFNFIGSGWLWHHKTALKERSTIMGPCSDKFGTVPDSGQTAARQQGQDQIWSSERPPERGLVRLSAVFHLEGRPACSTLRQHAPSCERHSSECAHVGASQFTPVTLTRQAET